MDLPVSSHEDAVKLLKNRKPDLENAAIDTLHSYVEQRQIGKSMVNFFIIAMEKGNDWVVQADDGTVMTKLEFLENF